MKKILLLLLSAVFLIACSINGVEQQSNKVDKDNKNIDMDIVKTSSSFASWAIGGEFSEQNKNDSSVIAVITFESIAGGERIKNYEDLYSWIYTKGQMPIESVIKGELMKVISLTTVKLGNSQLMNSLLVK